MQDQDFESIKAIKYLKQAGIAHKVKTFSPNTPKGASNVADQFKMDPHIFLKTLIFEGYSKKLYLVIVGGNQEVNTDLLQKSTNEESIKMANPDILKDRIGYVIGSIPPFNLKEDVVVILDSSIEKMKEVAVGTGQWGVEIFMTPENLLEASKGKYSNITQREYKKNIDELRLNEKCRMQTFDLPGEQDAISISNLKEFVSREVLIKGWMYNKRSSGSIAFLQLRDGTGFIQGIVEKSKVDDTIWQASQDLTIESSCIVKGIVKEDKRSPSGVELDILDIQIVMISPEFPIGKKEHGPEFLFDNRDLYLRSKTPWACLKIRNQVFLSITNFFYNEGFIRFDTPILQPTSCEDTTQLFELKYYENMMYLTQSGQLYSEAGIMGFGKVYDFGPVFRAEKSKTRHHLSELWMMDAEMAYYDQKMNMDLQERMVKRIVKDVLNNCQTELNLLERDQSILQDLVNKPFLRVKHRDIKKELADDKEFHGCVDLMDDMTTDEEIYLGNKYKLPIFIEDYPFKVKAFYMKSYMDQDGTKRARNADLIAPEEGREIIGGSQREDDYNILLDEIIARNYPLEDYEWYLNVRKYGSVAHAGFGIGFERTIRWITGVHHIRETIPFPRTLNRNKP